MNGTSSIILALSTPHRAEARASADIGQTLSFCCGGCFFGGSFILVYSGQEVEQLRRESTAEALIRVGLTSCTRNDTWECICSYRCSG